MQALWGAAALGSIGWLLYLAAMVVIVPIGVVAVAAYACVKASRRQAREREQAGAEAEARRVAEAEAEAPRPRARPSGRARGMLFGWTYDLFDVDSRPGAILAVFEPYTDHSVGYLFEDHPLSEANPIGVECAGVYPHPSRTFPADALWLHRPELARPCDAHGGDFTQRVTLAMFSEVDAAYGDKPEPKPLRGYGSRGRRR